jgi:hypothetical protein
MAFVWNRRRTSRVFLIEGILILDSGPLTFILNNVTLFYTYFANDLSLSDLFFVITAS